MTAVSAAEAWLDFAVIAGAPVDLGALQVLVVSWWHQASPALRSDARLGRLFARLDVAPAGER